MAENNRKENISRLQGYLSNHLSLKAKVFEVTTEGNLHYETWLG